MIQTLTTVVLSREHDVVLARQRARQVSELLGFDGQDQARVATAVSELARNAFEYAGGGKVQYLVSDAADSELVVRIVDRGPGIGDLEAVLDGRYRSQTGMGLGIVGARRLMDRFEIDSVVGAGTRVLVAKTLPGGRPPSNGEIAGIAEALAGPAVDGPLGELQLQNQELMRTLDELQRRQEELARLNRELEETNRGVVALYAELDERAEELARASETKSRFLSSVSHELRTPLSSILALCDLLIDRTDGPLTAEQERQVAYIRAGAETLLMLVNDLLDLARIEAGKTTVNPTTFAVEELFGSLRGMFRPLHRNADVALVFERADHLPTLHTDEPKLAQVLRNFISNALKFTERGEVRVSASLGEDAGTVVFSVTDSGVGIAREDRDRIFDEFVQLDTGLPQRAKGTGLGLPVSRRLAGILGGDVAVDSEPGRGSTFTVTVPTTYRGGETAEGADVEPERGGGAGLDGVRVLLVDDEEAPRYVARRMLAGRGCRITEAATGSEAIQSVRDERPDLVVLDLKMPDGDGFFVLRELSDDPSTAAIPVVVHTAMRLSPEERALLEHRASALLDKHEAGGEELALTVARVVGRGGGGA